MPDTQLIGLVLLLAVAVVFGYFYFKRAQGRRVDSSPELTAPASQTPASNAEAASEETGVRRDPVDEA